MTELSIGARINALSPNGRRIIDAVMTAFERDQGPSSSPVMVLYRRYVELTQAALAYVHDPAETEAVDEALERLFYRERDAIDDAMMLLESASASDMAAKMLVAHCHGDITGLDFDTAPVWREARQLVGGAT